MPYRPPMVVAITDLGVSHCLTCFDPDTTTYLAANSHAMIDDEACERCGAPIPQEPPRTSDYVHWDGRHSYITAEVELEWMAVDAARVSS